MICYKRIFYSSKKMNEYFIVTCELICFRMLPLAKDKNSIIYYDYVTVVCKTEIFRLPVLSILSVVPLGHSVSLFCYNLKFFSWFLIWFKLLMAEHRHVGSTNFNLLSSRSHTIFTLVFFHYLSTYQCIYIFTILVEA